MALRPYLLVYKGETHIIEAQQAAAAVHHVVGADISVLRPARAAEVSAWHREGKSIPIAGQKEAVADATMEEVRGTPAPVPGDAALRAFEDWAGYDRLSVTTSVEAGEAMQLMHAAGNVGAMDLMTFDRLRQLVGSEFECAIIAAEMSVPRGEDDQYVAAVERVRNVGLGRVRARLEELPMPYDDVVKAIAHHAGLLGKPAA